MARAGEAGGQGSAGPPCRCLPPPRWLRVLQPLGWLDLTPARPPFTPHLSLHLQPGLRNTSDEGLCDVGVALGTLAMVMPQQGAQGTGRDVTGEGEVLLITRVAAGQQAGR